MTASRRTLLPFPSEGVPASQAPREFNGEQRAMHIPQERKLSSKSFAILAFFPENALYFVTGNKQYPQPSPKQNEKKYLRECAVNFATSHRTSWVDAGLYGTWILPAFRAANMHCAVLKACRQLW